ncbi:MAG: hypothetical protein ACFFD4_28465 [Candidatus Odinarchaeota archaeon]
MRKLLLITCCLLPILTGITDTISLTITSSATEVIDHREVTLFPKGRNNGFSLVKTLSGPSLTLTGHTGKINGVSFNNNGSFLASASDDGTIKIWDVTSGKELLSIMTSSSRVTSVAFNPNGSGLLSGSLSSNIPTTLWNASSGVNISSLQGPVSDVWSVAYSPDGETLAAGFGTGSPDNAIILWKAIEAYTPQVLAGHGSRITDLAFSKAGEFLVSSSVDQTVKLWDLTTDTEIRTLTGHVDQVSSVALSTDGVTIASGAGGQDQTVKLWNALTGSLMHTLTDHTSNVTGLTFSSDGKTLASCSLDNTIKIWDVPSARLLQTLTGETSHFCIAFSPDNQTLASGSDDGTIRLWRGILDDRDGDGMADTWETANGLDNMDSTDGTEDLDEDGLRNDLEFQFGTDPRQADTDGDTLPDGYEYFNGLDGNVNDAVDDTDGDGMPNLWEYLNGLQAGNYTDAGSDLDGDGLTNLIEYQFGSWANRSDTDSDNMPDRYEWENGLNGTLDDAGDDRDGDGLTNLQEFEFGSRANLQDSEGDGIDDLYEFQMGLDPRENDANSDKDGDGLTNLEEYNLGTRADKADTDGDGFSDKLELVLGSDPLLPESSPLVLGFVILFIGFLTAIGIFVAWKYKQRAETRELLQRYGAPDHGTARKIEKGGFPDYKVYQQAQRYGARTMAQLKLIQRYNAPDYGTALNSQLDDFTGKLRNLGRYQSQWSFSTVAEKLSIPEKSVPSALRKLLRTKRIEGEIDNTTRRFTSYWSTEDELRRVKELITQIREGIPVPLTRIAEKTGLEINRCERVVKELTSGTTPAGEYLDIEGVFIKSDATMEAIDKLLEQYDDWEKIKKGKE